MSLDNSGYLVATALVVLVAVLWYVYAAHIGSLDDIGKIPGVLILAFLFLTVGGLFMSGVSVWRARDRETVRTTWVSTDAVVVTREVFQPMRTFNPTAYQWDSRASRWTDESFGLRTTWRYTTPSGEEREGATQICCVLNPDTSAEQVLFHAPGSRHRVYVNPADVTKLRVKDSGPIRDGGPYAAARQGYWLAAGGALCFVISRLIVRRI